MTPFVFTTAGGYLQTKSSGSSIWFSGSATKHSLACPTSNKGDFKNPTAFRFKRKFTEWPLGWTRTQGSTWWTNLEGRGCGGDVVDAETNATIGTALDPYNKALAKVYDQIRTDIDLSIDIYQYRQTLRTLAKLAKVLKPHILLYESLNAIFIQKHKIRRFTKMSGGLWLEWQYGVSPTLSTMHTLVSGAINEVSRPEGFHTVKGRGSFRADFRKAIPGGTAGNYWSSNLPCLIESFDKRRCEIGLTYSIGDAERNALSQFTSLNPVSFFYENVPFSFVLDWAYDVGGYLRMLETAVMTGLVFKSGYVTTTRRRHSSVTVSGRISRYGTRYTGHLVGTSWVKSLDRTLLHAMPRPRIPQIRVKLGTERLLSAASLLTNLLNHPSSGRK